MNYNLLSEKWIPVLWRDGTVGRVGIKEALSQAHRIREIAASNPMDNISLFRFLLALLQWCKPKPNSEELDCIERGGGIAVDWLAKLSEAEAQFVVADNGRYFQDESSPCGNPEPAAKLLHELPARTNIAHFRHTRDFRDGICPACYAIGLVRSAAYASASKKGKDRQMPAGINGNAPTYSAPLATNLLAALRCEWPVKQNDENDLPAWTASCEQAQMSFLKGLTWKSRRVAIATVRGHVGDVDRAPRCAYCGEKKDSLVTSIIFQPGWERPSKDRWAGDPHLLLLTRKVGVRGKEKKMTSIVRCPGPNDALEKRAAAWRDVMEASLQRLKPSNGDTNRVLTTLIGASQETYKDAAVETMAFPALGEKTIDALLAQLDWLRKISWTLTAARTDNWRDAPKGHRIVEALCAPGAKGYAIRSGLSAFSETAERDLEKAFTRLMDDLATLGAWDSEATPPLIKRWRDGAVRILGIQARWAVKVSAVGSPFRRREAATAAEFALSNEVGKNKPRGAQL